MLYTLQQYRYDAASRQSPLSLLAPSKYRLYSPRDTGISNLYYTHFVWQYIYTIYIILTNI